eukprot:TRINITY_DN6257_c0_g1_i1.p1 TRINITY_DN6257_c0_g1~~TRINITY_DN6257_c0_g1_i1.p1  ORF type:complete len:216 (-),score=32.27 TRINITY_DN6257_c0_g1_i1:20-667(-)
MLCVKLICVFMIVLSVKIGSSTNIEPELSPPVPELYSTLMYFDKLDSFPNRYFVDLMHQKKTRMDVPIANGGHRTTLSDITNSVKYIWTNPQNCYKTSLRNPYVPFFYFPNQKYVGKTTCQIVNTNQECNVWKGCHPYEIPPAPFVLEAVDGSNVPSLIEFPSINNQTIYFGEFKDEIPSESLFAVPTFCKDAKFVEEDHISDIFGTLVPNEELC